MDLHPHTLCGPLQFQKTIDKLFQKKPKLGFNVNNDLNYYMIELTKTKLFCYFLSNIFMGKILVYFYSL